MARPVRSACRNRVVAVAASHVEDALARFEIGKFEKDGLFVRIDHLAEWRLEPTLVTARIPMRHSGATT
jgi:hypothetical protein